MKIRNIWEDTKCNVIALDAVLNYHLQNINSPNDAINRLNEMKLQNVLVYKDFKFNDITTKLTLIGVNDKDADYELYKYPWDQYICPGTIALDIGTAYGDTTLPMALVNGKNGYVLGFDLEPGRYLVLEWLLKLHPTLNIIPYNFGVKADGKPEWVGFNRNTARIVPIFDWFQHKFKSYVDKVSFIKIDIDGDDINIVRSYKKLSLASRPLILIEWFLNDRVDEPCSKPKSLDIWNVASEIKYHVYDYTMRYKFESCNAAINIFREQIKLGKASSFTECGKKRNDFDICDVILVPIEMSTNNSSPSLNRMQYCPQQLQNMEIELLRSKFI